MKTNRDVLIEAGVPAEELAAVDCEHRLDEEWWGDLAYYLLTDRRVFDWDDSEQGYAFWESMALYISGLKPNPPPSGCAEDPYRVDPDDLERGEMVVVWIPGGAEAIGKFSRRNPAGAFQLQDHVRGHVANWAHARRATPEELRDAGIEPADGEPEPDISATTDYEQAALDATPYADLWQVLLDVYHQVSEGKGAERHGGGQAFRDQPMQHLIKLYGEGFALGQAAKKMQEAQRMEPEAARRELLGAMAYIAGAVVYRDGEGANEEDEENDDE
jgi:hypothetical protein